MADTRLIFFVNFPYSQSQKFHRSREYRIHVARKEKDLLTSDQTLVDILNEFGLDGIPVIKDKLGNGGQMCFGDTARYIPSGQEQENLVEAFEKLDDKTVSEVADHWKKADKKIDTLIKNLMTVEDVEKLNCT